MDLEITSTALPIIYLRLKERFFLIFEEYYILEEKFVTV